MKKAVLISIKPEWVCKILNGEKTIEVRKTAPRCELPIEVYIYCTKSKDFLLDRDRNFFVWEKHEHHYLYEFEEEPKEHYFQGKVVAKFTLNKVEEMRPFFHWCIEKETCLTADEVLDYLDSKDKSVGNPKRQWGKVYAWQIEDLEIFDEPKELDEFDYPNPSGTRYVSKRSLNGLPSKKHPPQSWCYVEERK